MSLYGENLQGDNMGILGSTRGQKTPKPRHNMLLTSIKRRVLGNGSHFKLVFVPEHLGHRRARTEEPYYTPSTWVSENLVEMSLKSFFMSHNNFLLEKDLRAMKWVVSNVYWTTGS